MKNGDKVVVDVKDRTINMEVSDEEIAKRLSEVDWELDGAKFKPFLRLFAKNVTSTAKGATWGD